MASSEEDEDDLCGLGEGFPPAAVLATVSDETGQRLLDAVTPRKADPLARAAVAAMRRKKPGPAVGAARAADPSDDPTDDQLLEQCERSMTTALQVLRRSLASLHDADNMAAVLRRVRKRLGVA